MLKHGREPRTTPTILTIEGLQQFFEDHPGSSIHQNSISKDVLRKLRDQSHPVEFCASKKMISQNPDYRPPKNPKLD